ncbi:tetratricopeptide repeat protein [Caballeronia sp. BR00000012568055]|uniref:tetratricopeptide repeat protein n=1 Tax=Caballeronia sp. BR00000012568055 TaxID=2918761 RepID=UPI0023F62FF3|nr:tetratricopeptide repeat protein [Caballeronia sp. BR00000012568055]
MTEISLTPAAATLTPEQQFEHDIALVMQSAIEHHTEERFDDAEALYEAIIGAVPNHGDANYNLAVLKVQTDRPADAIALFETALGIAPNNGNYWVSYINALRESGQTAAAWIAVEIAQKQGVHGPALDGLILQMATPGVALQTSANGAQPIQITLEAAAQPGTPEQKPADNGRRASKHELDQHAMHFAKSRFTEAVTAARKLVKRYPSDGMTWRALTISLHKHGDFLEAIETARKTLAMLPADPITHLLLADTLRLLGRSAECEAAARALLAVDPQHAEGHRLLALAQATQGRSDAAIITARRAIELAPNVAAGHSALGFILLEQGVMRAAEESFRRAIELNPMDDVSHSNMLFCLTHNENITPDDLREQHGVFGARHEERVRALWPEHTNNRDTERQLRIGLVSGDLFNHAVSSYLVPVIRHLTEDASLSLHFYQNDPRVDATTDLLRGWADSWQEVTGLTNEAFAAQVRRDRIDILIDLSGHTGRNRLVALARKPAPVQVSWIGYPATTGLKAMDYQIADRFIAPEGEFEKQYLEKIIRLPAIAPFMPPQHCPPVNGLPALHNGYITYGSFNRLNKLRPDVIAVWARVLHADPTSRMILGATGRDLDRKQFLDWFAAEGIDASRLAFRPRAGVPVYLQQHHQVDLCLDAFPYAGSTTTLNALWMGVPTVTIPGDTLASRGSACWLSHVGLSEFIARDRDDFVEKAIALSRDTVALNALRTSLRERCTQSAAFQPAKVAAGLSQALRTIWTRWCKGQATESFEVSLPSADALPSVNS